MRDGVTLETVIALLRRSGEAIKKQDEWKLYLFSFLNLFFLFRLEFAFFPHILKVVSVIGIFIGIFKYRLTIYCFRMIYCNISAL